MYPRRKVRVEPGRHGPVVGAFVPRLLMSADAVELLGLADTLSDGARQRGGVPPGDGQVDLGARVE